MPTLSRRPRATLSLAALFAATLAYAPAHAEPAAEAPAPAATARSLDLSDGETLPLADGLRPDLGSLLEVAQYRRVKDMQDAPRHSITSVSRIAEAIRAHRGVGYLVLAERVDGGDTVSIQALYVLEGSPIGGPAGTGAKTGTAGTAGAPDKGGFILDLNGEAARPLIQSLHGHLAALLPPAGQGSAVSAEDAIDALRGHAQVSYVVLTERSGEAAVDRTRVIVVPDVMRISIVDDVAPAVADDTPEVELVPGAAGEPPMVKFHFDPAKYDITKKK